jgi:transposase
MPPLGRGQIRRQFLPPRHLCADSRRHRQYLRTLFIQAANIILMPPHNWEKLSFGAWLKEAAARLHRNKAASALANKLAGIAWSVLRNGKAFDVNPHEVEAI